MKTVTHTASFVVDCYDILAERWLDILPADEREIALLAIIARARQGLDDMGRLPAAIGETGGQKEDGADAWHRVTDQLPDDDVTVLIAAPALSGEPIAAYLCGGDWVRESDYTILPRKHVTAWRDVPALPEDLPAVLPGANPARIA